MTDMKDDEGQADKIKPWLRPVLFASLVLNLFLIGLIATSFLMHRHHPRSGLSGAVPPPFFRMLHDKTGRLPKEDRAAVRKIMVNEFPSLRSSFRKIEEARKELADILALELYDKDKVRAAFDKIDSAQAAMVDVTREAMVNGFAKMEPAQRKRIAESMRVKAMKRLSRERRPPKKPGDEKD